MVKTLVYRKKKRLPKFKREAFQEKPCLYGFFIIKTQLFVSKLVLNTTIQAVINKVTDQHEIN
jgi:hypothetical protein